MISLFNKLIISIIKTKKVLIRIQTLKLIIVCFLLIQQSVSSAQNFPKGLITPQEVYMEIVCEEILHPEIVLRQAILETGWFKSKHMMQKNNLFGFRYAKTYMTFDSWQESVAYYKAWQMRKYINTNEDYYAFLVRIKYAQSQQYVSLLKRIKIKNLILENDN